MTDATENKIEWCWAIESSERANGPFASREEAIEDAREELTSGSKESEPKKQTIILGHPIYAKADEYIAVDMAELLESMDECAYDNEFGFYDDEIFDVQSDEREDAEKDLQKVLEEWARKWVYAAPVWFLDAIEKIEIELGQPSCEVRSCSTCKHEGNDNPDSPCRNCAPIPEGKYFFPNWEPKEKE